MKFLNSKIIIVTLVIISFLLYTSCMFQLTSVPKLKSLAVSENNTALLAISADYEMNMSKSNDVKFYLKEINTGKIISPDYRDNELTNLYFNVKPGKYRILLITIKETSIVKSIIFDDSSKTITKTIGLVDASKLKSLNTGFSLSGAILLGDKNLVYANTFSNTLNIEPNSAYFLGEFWFEGYIESVFNDMPNILIKRNVSPTQAKIESFKKIYNNSYPNTSDKIKLTEKIFNVDLIDLSKENAVKKSTKVKSKN